MELRNAEKRLLIAVSQIIENEGFNKIEVNKIAKQAKCDKVLIYRYFGGLEGLLSTCSSVNALFVISYAISRIFIIKMIIKIVILNYFHELCSGKHKYYEYIV